MRTPFLFFILFAVLFFSSCRSLSYFDSPNNLRNIEGTLLLKNGKSMEGKLVIEMENLFSRPVKLFTADEKRPMQFGLDEVTGYRVANVQYELKEIKEGVSLGRQLFFMRRLTPEASRIHLFELMKKSTANKTSVRHDPDYFVQLPGEKGNMVYASNGSHFVPHFEEKVSQMVKDCPALAQKIVEKEPGYFYAQVSLLREKRADVLMRIIDDYNRCTTENK